MIFNGECYSGLTDVGFVTPEMYGAKGDGATDDADAFEDALNSGKPVFVPAKSYYISRSLNNPEKAVLIGSGRRKTSIKLADTFFDNAVNNGIIQDIYFYCTYSDSNTFYVFEKKLQNTRVANCEFRFFDKIFYRLEQCCVVTGNWFSTVKSNFATQVTDSFISENYFSGGTQTVYFPYSCTTTEIVGNFFSYCYKVFATQYMGSIKITGNQFNLCYCIFYNHIDGVTFTDNVIAMLKKSVDWDVSDNNDMNTKAWTVMRRVIDNNVSWWWKDAVFADNVIYGDFDMYMECESLTRYPTYNFLVDENYDASKFNYGAKYNSAIQHDQENVMIRPMLKRTVNALPSPALTGEVVSFNHDEVVYNDNVYINVNGTWKQMTS